MKSKIIAIWFEKGGGGKTTTAFNLAAGLARKSKKVLLVDVDPTAGSTKHAGLTPNTLQSTLADPLLNVLRNIAPNTEEYLHRVESDPFDILPANAFLDTIEDTVKKVFSGLEVGQALGGVLEPLKDKYDYIIIDCAPSTRIYNTSALAIADEVIMPMRANFLDFGGLDDATDAVNTIKTNINPKLRNRGILLTNYRHINHTRLIEEGLECLKEEKGVETLQTRISHGVDVAEASMRGLSIYAYKKSGKQAKEYQSLVEEILNG
ncbi:ParA family protein [Sinanaerobacter sp. ZZT-01]|uniref:ParA family protein n=1 Tax=Sinanaerobacter sp. ZZT-01 TaxID=3111540 RepID=UPI002D79F7FF|nr:ParA family protein [Sinanaerobacter sp. ZZT-01]WRR93394.1 ParA family protein [Sinanaerobacter sp. ZZT-01]